MARARVLAGSAAILLAVGVALAPALSAQAADASTTIAFSESTPVAAQFAGDWVIPIVVAPTSDEYAVSASAGTVDVFVSGLAGPYASGLPLFPGGRAFFAQPAARDPLPAGSYDVTAVFQPAAGSGFASSQTVTSASLTITPIALTAQTRAVEESTSTTAAEVELSLSGPFVETFGRAPEGEWSVTATAEGATAFEGTVAQGASLDPVPLRLTGLEPDTEYTITSSFSPATTSAGGIELTESEPVRVTTAEPIRPPWYAAPVDWPAWAVGLGAATLVLLLAAVGVLAAAVASERRRRRVPAPAEPARDTAPTPPAS